MFLTACCKISYVLYYFWFVAGFQEPLFHDHVHVLFCDVFQTILMNQVTLINIVCIVQPLTSICHIREVYLCKTWQHTHSTSYSCPLLALYLKICHAPLNAAQPAPLWFVYLHMFVWLITAWLILASERPD